ncbi:peptidyl-prolyl cis-trans isomerase [Treponema parvum]|uniref:peptidylprolyl isomerase n=1 Tax=Treponema parvum TaxID=138851 RepID=A0A975EZ71_9SPIR|nr:peptidylprolyl isomerase [Treponema parvum]QTQ11094.1 peptidyl-prolyl cis-trans isomerase [Treponema parvum]QTQ16966.1 peptidyl-prolyl cis-trans isomerase [Treponema parvum]
MKRIAAGVVLVLMTLAGLAAQSDLQVLAVVKLNKNETVTLKELRNRVEIYQKQNNKVLDVEQRRSVLEALVNEKLILQAAQKANVTVTDSQVDQSFLQYISQQLGQAVTEQQFADFIRKQENLSLDDFFERQFGLTLAGYKAHLKTQLIVQRYILSQKRDELQSVMPTDKEIRSFYEMNKATFVQSDILRMFLAMVPKGQDSAAAKNKAEELLNDYKNKTQTLDQLSVRSRIENSGFQAGELTVSKTQQHAHQLGLSYNDLLTLFSRDPGYVSDITETDKDFQFYVIQEKFPAKMLELSDVVQPGTTVTVYDYIKQNLTQQKQSQFMLKAAQDISASLNTDENVEWKKAGPSLDKLLAWEGKN